MTRFAFVLFVLIAALTGLVLAAALTGCNSAPPTGGGGGITDADIVGTWQPIDAAAPQITMRFDSNGSGQGTWPGGGQEFTWSLNGSEVTITWPSERQEVYTMSSLGLLCDPSDQILFKRI